jgi:hypothetical protein
MKPLSFAYAVATITMTAQTIRCPFTPKDSPLALDPAARFWKDTPIASFAQDSFGKDSGFKPTEVRIRWSRQFLYVLFVGPYEVLHLKPGPQTTKDTVPLWDWDVAEMFIGSDFENIQRYKEFEVSPQGEWVDLDVRKDLNEFDWHWNSAFEPSARIDEKLKIWYGGMKIPWKAIDTREPDRGREFRVNFYRIEGPPPNRKFFAWQPTKSASYHVPEAFGRLLLVP